MKRNSTLFRLGSLLTASLLSASLYAQNTSPFWSLAGNSNANSVSKLGTTTADPLNITTNNLTRLRINADGKVGIGTSSPQQLLHVEGQTLLNIFVSTSALSNISGSGQIGYTKFTPTAAGQRLGYFLFGSRGGAENNYHGGGMVGYADGAWSSTSWPTNLAFETAPSGSSTRQERMRITSGGNVGIGTTAPQFVLDVRTTSSSFGQFKAGSGYAGIILDKSAAAQNEYIIHRTAGADMWTEGMISNNNFSIHNWGGTGADAVTISLANNFVGIGATDPAFRLDVAGRMRLRSGGGSAGLWLNNSGNTGQTGFIGVLNDNHMGLYGATSGWSVLMNTDNGYLGVKNANPTTELHVIHGTNSGSTFGLRIQNVGSNNHEWTQYVQNSDGSFQLYHNGALRGTFDETSGSYTPISDARFKKNVEKSEDVLDKIMKLGVKRYQFNKNQTDDRKYYGMIAQEVEKVFPDVVFHRRGDDGKDAYTMDYGAMGTIAIKGIQELKPSVDKQQEEINQLRQEVAELKQMLTRLAAGQSSLPLGNSGTLGMVTPNPAKGVARIQYAIPEGTANARLLVTDALGRTIKVVQLSRSGTVNVDVSALSSGVYNYSLVADGKTVETKKMTVER